MAKSQKSQGVDLSKIELGELDAGLDANFLHYAVALPTLEHIRDRKMSIIVGPKGAGKTGIRLKFTADVSPLQTINLSEKDSIDFGDLKTKNPNEIKKKIEAYMIAIVSDWLMKRTAYNTAPLEKFKDAPLFSFAQRLFTATKLSVPFVTIALSEIFPPDKKTSVTYLISDDFAQSVRSVIGLDRNLWLLIDDIDSFVSTERGEERRVALEQTLYAISDLNLRLLKDRVWVVAFLKSEVFKEVRKVSPELDKARDYIEHIKWTAEMLRKVVRDRIEWNVKQQGLSIADHPWTDIFDKPTPSGIDSFFAVLLSKAVNGPRNAIELMKLCIKDAIENGDQRIGEKNIARVIVQYGSEVLTDLSSFYQHVYPGVDDLVDTLFRGFCAEFTRSELESRIKTEFLHKAEVRENVGQPWSLKSTAYKLIDIFYEIGVIGWYPQRKKHLVYSFEERDAHFGPSDKLAVHPGLRAFLETQ